MSDLTEVTHVLENLLDRIRKGEMALTGEHVDAFLVAKDILKMQLDGHRLHTPVDQEAVADARMMLQELSQGAGAGSAAAAIAEVKPESAEADLAKFANVKRCYRIELPQVAERDSAALSAELGLLGTPVRRNYLDKRLVLTLGDRRGRRGHRRHLLLHPRSG